MPTHRSNNCLFVSSTRKWDRWAKIGCWDFERMLNKPFHVKSRLYSIHSSPTDCISYGKDAAFINSLCDSNRFMLILRRDRRLSMEEKCIPWKHQLHSYLTEVTLWRMWLLENVCAHEWIWIGEKLPMTYTCRVCWQLKHLIFPLFFLLFFVYIASYPQWNSCATFMELDVYEETHTLMCMPWVKWTEVSSNIVYHISIWTEKNDWTEWNWKLVKLIAALALWFHFLTFPEKFVISLEGSLHSWNIFIFLFGVRD